MTCASGASYDRADEPGLNLRELRIDLGHKAVAARSRFIIFPTMSANLMTAGQPLDQWRKILRRELVRPPEECCSA